MTRKHVRLFDRLRDSFKEIDKSFVDRSVLNDAAKIHQLEDQIDGVFLPDVNLNLRNVTTKNNLKSNLKNSKRF